MAMTVRAPTAVSGSTPKTVLPNRRTVAPTSTNGGASMVGYWLRWMGVTLVGFMTGFVGSFVLIDVASGGAGPERFGIPFAVALPAVLALAVSLMATLQWLLLRRRLPGSAAWIPATAVGVLAGALMVFGLAELLGQERSLPRALVRGVVDALVVGAPVGFAQWLVLRRVDPARRWVWVTVAAFVVAGIIGEVAGWHTDGGIGLIVIFLVWQGLAAPTLHRLTTTTADRPASIAA
jgi:hypothetical protein